MYEDGVVPHIEAVRTSVRPSVQRATTDARRRRPGSRRGSSSDDSNTHLLISVRRDAWWSDWLRVSLWYGVNAYDPSFIATCALSSLNDHYASWTCDLLSTPLSTNQWHFICRIQVLKEYVSSKGLMFSTGTTPSNLGTLNQVKTFRNHWEGKRRKKKKPSENRWGRIFRFTQVDVQWVSHI